MRHAPADSASTPVIHVDRALVEEAARQEAARAHIAFVTGPDGAEIVVENTGYAPIDALVLENETCLGAFHEENENTRQVADPAWPGFAHAVAEGVAVTELIAAGLVEVTDGADRAETVRDRLGMDRVVGDAVVDVT